MEIIIVLVPILLLVISFFSVSYLTNKSKRKTRVRSLEENNQKLILAVGVLRKQLDEEQKNLSKTQEQFDREKQKWEQEKKNLEHELREALRTTRYQKPSMDDRNTYASMFSIEEGQRSSVVEAYGTMFSTIDGGLKQILSIVEEMKQQKREAKSVLKSLTGDKKSRVPIIISPEILAQMEREISNLRKSFRTVEENGQVSLMYENPLYNVAEEQYTKYLYFKGQSKNDYAALPNTLKQIYVCIGYFEAAKKLEDLMAAGNEESSTANYPPEWSDKDGMLVDFYVELELAPYDISEEQLKKAYRKRSIVTHPDKGGSNEAFARTKLANEVLGDSALKSRYDEYHKNVFSK